MNADFKKLTVAVAIAGLSRRVHWPPRRRPPLAGVGGMVEAGVTMAEAGAFPSPLACWACSRSARSPARLANPPISAVPAI